MDVGIVAAAFVLTHFIARRIGVPGPGTWAVLCSLAVASWRLHATGTRWDELGLRMPESGAVALAWMAMLFVAAPLMKVLVVDPLAKTASWPPLNLSRFANLPGNTAYLAGGLLLVWIQAAFGEEMLFRGFLLTSKRRRTMGGCRVWHWLITHSEGKRSRMRRLTNLLSDPRYKAYLRKMDLPD